MDAGYLLAPLSPLPVFQGEDFLFAPVEVIGEEGGLLVELLQRIAYDAPKGTVSTSKVLSHLGHMAVTSGVPFWLTRW